jgi:hypothetical protein
MCAIEQVCPKVAENWIFAQALNCHRYAVKLEDMSWVDMDYYIFSRLDVPSNSGTQPGQESAVEHKNEAIKLMRKLQTED